MPLNTQQKCPKCKKTLENISLYKHMAAYHPKNDNEKEWSEYYLQEKEYKGSSYFLSFGPHY